MSMVAGGLILALNHRVIVDSKVNPETNEKGAVSSGALVLPHGVSETNNPSVAAALGEVYP